MRPGMANAKGGAFEREIAKSLSLWITQGAQKDALWRSAQSGGRATQALKSGERLDAQAGDLVAVDSAGLHITQSFVIECKHRADMGFYNLCVNHAGPLANFWRKLVQEAGDHGKLPMLIFKENRRKVLVGLCGNGVHLWGAETLAPVRVETSPELYLMHYEKLLSIADPFEFEERAKSLFR